MIILFQNELPNPPPRRLYNPEDNRLLKSSPNKANISLRPELSAKPTTYFNALLIQLDNILLAVVLIKLLKVSWFAEASINFPTVNPVPIISLLMILPTLVLAILLRCPHSLMRTVLVLTPPTSSSSTKEVDGSFDL